MERDPSLEPLARALRDAEPSGSGVPPEVDRAVRARIHAHFAAVPARRRRWRLVIGVAAAAAVIALAVLVAQLARQPAPVAAPQRIASQPDVDRSGRVDMLDAFTLARAVEAGSAAGGPDLDGNGVVDDTDVDLLARRAVALGNGRGS